MEMSTLPSINAREGEGGEKEPPIRLGEMDNNSPNKDDGTPTNESRKEEVAKPSATGGESLSEEVGTKHKEQSDGKEPSEDAHGAKKPRTESEKAPPAAAADDSQTESEDDSIPGPGQKKADDQQTLQAKVVASSKEQAVAKQIIMGTDPRDADIQQLGLRARNDRRIPFPQILYAILENDAYRDACCWLPDGLSFALDPEIFDRKVVQVHFRGSKFDSFKRKLNRWGFRRLTESEAPGTLTYYNRLFRRGYPGLLKQMNGGRIVVPKNKPMFEEPPPDAASAMDPASDGQAVLAAAMMRGGIPTGLGPVAQVAPGGPAGMPMSVPTDTTAAMHGADMNRILMEQDRLRLELARKSQEEADLRQKLQEEMFRRKAQEEQMQMLIGTPRFPPAAAQFPGLALPPIAPFPPTGFGATMSPSNFGVGPGFGAMQQFPQGQAGLAGLDPSAPLAAPLPQGATNDQELSQFRNMNHQQAQDFERRVQEEIARRRQQGDPGEPPVG